MYNEKVKLISFISENVIQGYNNGYMQIFSYKSVYRCDIFNKKKVETT